MVDLPSFGSADVIPTTRFVLAVPFRSIASLIERIASEKREKGASTTVLNAMWSHTILRAPIAFVSAF